MNLFINIILACNGPRSKYIYRKKFQLKRDQSVISAPLAAASGTECAKKRSRSPSTTPFHSHDFKGTPTGKRFLDNRISASQRNAKREYCSRSFCNLNNSFAFSIVMRCVYVYVLQMDILFNEYKNSNTKLC